MRKRILGLGWVLPGVLLWACTGATEARRYLDGGERDSSSPRGDGAGGTVASHRDDAAPPNMGTGGLLDASRGESGVADASTGGRAEGGLPESSAEPVPREAGFPEASVDAHAPVDASRSDAGEGSGVCSSRSSGALAWVVGVGGALEDPSWASGVAALPDGSTLVSGNYQGGLVFGVGGPRETNLDSDRMSVFVAKYAPDGKFVWARRIRGKSGERVVSANVAGATDGSVLVTGWMDVHAIFAEGEKNEVTLTNTGISAFIAKYTADGTFVWVKQVTLGGNLTPYPVVAAAPGGATLMAYNTFLDEYDPGGVRLWSTQAEGSIYGPAIFTSVASLPDGVLVSGSFTDSATLGKGESQETALDAGTDGAAGTFVARYTAAGHLVWARKIGDPNPGAPTSIAAGPDGSAIVTGMLGGTATFGAAQARATTLTSAGDLDVYVARYTASGSLDWARRAGGAGADIGYGVSVSPTGSVYVTGSFSEAATFGGGEAGETTIQSAGHEDAFVAEYASGGNFVWVKRAGGTWADFGKSVAAQRDGPVVAGYFNSSPIVGSGTADFGSGEPGATTLESNGYEDVFLERLCAQ